MQDKAHIAVKGGFRQLLTLPDGTIWSSAERINTKDQVPFVMSIDVSSTQGVGSGTTGWAKMMDTDHPGGASVWSVDGVPVAAKKVKESDLDDFMALAARH